jgi:ABC-type lipoprotein release transport system permease subunit
VEFGQLLLVFGALLAAIAALLGWLRGVVLSISVLSVLKGMVFGWTGALRIEPENEELFDVIELALLLTVVQRRPARRA